MNLIDFINIDRYSVRMSRTVTAYEARVHFGEMLDFVRYSGDHCIITKHNKPIAQLIRWDDSASASAVPAIAAQVQQLAETLSTQLRLERIILFGSRAWGTPAVESDIDLCVIMKTRLRHLDRIDTVQAHIDPALAVDVVVYTPQEFAQRQRAGDPFITRIATEGVPLYERR